MRLAFRNLAYAVLLALIAVAGSALSARALADHHGEADTPRAIAEAYLDAYARQDFDAMRQHLTEDSVFVDPTSFDLVANRIDWQGPDAIIDGITSWGLVAIDYAVSRTYEASGQVVFEAVADVTYGAGYDNRRFRYNIVTIISVQDGQVIEHRDYTDFAGATELTGATG